MTELERSHRDKRESERERERQRGQGKETDGEGRASWDLLCYLMSWPPLGVTQVCFHTTADKDRAHGANSGVCVQQDPTWNSVGV